MLEAQRELEKAQGFRGPATRFFGPIDSAAEAAIVIREMCIALLSVSLFVGISSVRIGKLGLLAAAVIGVPALALLVSRHRVVAVVLFFCTALVFMALVQMHRLGGLFPLLFWIALLIIAGRASRATFKLHHFNNASVAGGTSGA